MCKHCKDTDEQLDWLGGWKVGAVFGVLACAVGEHIAEWAGGHIGPGPLFVVGLMAFMWSQIESEVF